MWLLFVTAFFIVVTVMAVRFDEAVCDTLPMTGAMTVLVLYLLALFRGMKLIYAVSAVVIIVSVFSIFRKMRQGQSLTEVTGRYFTALLQPWLLTFLVAVAGITFLTADQVFTWWDDINFWSSDAKQIFYLNGFPGKYGNVSPEFGDYPPVTSLFKWIFLQLSPDYYREGLQFSGYTTLNIVFLLPLLRVFEKQKEKNALYETAAMILLLLIPGIVNGIVYYGTPADITMGIVYGALLYAIWDKNHHSGLFYYGRIALFTAVLFLTKSVGIEWAVFALVFYGLLYGVNGFAKNTGMISAIIFSAAFYGSWLGFCLLNRRVAKATGMGIKMATGSYAVPANALDKARFFFLGMWTMPMHADHNITFDPPIGVILLIIIVAFVLMKKAGFLSKDENRAFSLHLVITGIITYGLIFVAHISLFQSEDQYLDAFAMTNSIARYGAPFVIGSIYIFIVIACEKCSAGLKKKVMYLIALFILLTADYSGMYKFLYGYRNSVGENIQYNSQMIDEGGAAFLSCIDGKRNLWGHRVLNLRSSSFNHWVHDTYISKEASPVPVIYETLMKEDTPETLSDKIIKSHAEYLYVEDDRYTFTGNEGSKDDFSMEKGEDKAKFSDERFFGFMPENEHFFYGEVYKIINENGKITLEKI